MIAPLQIEPNEERPIIRHWSFSRINRYLTCPEQYRLYYIENLRPRFPPSSLVFGQAIHQALAELFEKKGDAIKHFLETWNVLKDVELRYKERESWEKLKNSGEALLEKFIAEELPKFGAIHAVEQPFELSITTLDAPFMGIIDLEADVNGIETVVDFKTSGSSYDSDDAALSDQLTAYALAKPAAQRTALCVLVKTKEPRIEWHTVARSGTQFVEYVRKVGYVAEEINADRFYKRPGLWCSWCDFRPICVGDKKRAADSLVTIDSQTDESLKREESGYGN